MEQPPLNLTQEEPCLDDIVEKRSSQIAQEIPQVETIENEQVLLLHIMLRRNLIKVNISPREEKLASQGP